MLVIVTQYWYVLALVLLVLAVLVVNRYLKGRAKTVALQYLLAAEHMILTTTESKLSIVSVVGYNALPTPIKTIVSPLAFDLLVTSAYNEIKDLVAKLDTDPSVPLQSVVTDTSTSPKGSM